MMLTGVWLILVPLALFGYAYVAYPVLLWILARSRSRPPTRSQGECPRITVTIPAYNEVDRLGATLERLLALDYPSDRLHILVVSDASTDGTDEVALGFAHRGVELLRLERRSGKTAAENAAVSRIQGDVVVNIDATIGLAAHSLRALVGAFAEDSVGVASGRDISVGDAKSEGNRGESGYVGYEMRVRALETDIDSIVGASGCFYAMRRELHAVQLPEDLSRDFGAVLVAREHGFRSVSIQDAVCFVPRTVALDREYRRKVRTMARGLRTLWYKRHLLNPVRHGRFAWMLWSHKLCRWLVPLTSPLVVLGAVLIGVGAGGLAWLPLGALAAGVLTALAGFLWPKGHKPPGLLAMAAYVVAGNVAGMAAWISALSGGGTSVWEPTRRPNTENNNRES